MYCEIAKTHRRTPRRRSIRKTRLHESSRRGGDRVSHSRLQRYNGSARLFIQSHNGSYVRRAVWNWNSGNWSRANNCCVLIGRRSSFEESGLKEKPGSNLCRRRSLFIRESNASGLHNISKAAPLMHTKFNKRRVRYVKYL